MARKAPLSLHTDKDPDTAFMSIFYPSSIATSFPASAQTPPFSCSLLTLPPPTPKDIYTRKSASCAVFQSAEETGDINTLMAHANEVLEQLDHRLSPQGGLLALLPPDDDENGKESERSIFGRWLRYTQALVGRVAELEREVALMRKLLGGGHITPSARGRRTASGKARETVLPQDRYVLAGLNDALWVRLNEDLDITAGMTAAKNGRAEEQLRPKGQSGQGLNGNSRYKSDGLNVVSWVEVTSHVFRVKGQESVFIIPAWDTPRSRSREKDRKPATCTDCR